MHKLHATEVLKRYSFAFDYIVHIWTKWSLIKHAPLESTTCGSVEWCGSVQGLSSLECEVHPKPPQVTAAAQLASYQLQPTKDAAEPCLQFLSPVHPCFTWLRPLQQAEPSALGQRGGDEMDTSPAASVCISRAQGRKLVQEKGG